MHKIAIPTPLLRLAENPFARPATLLFALLTAVRIGLPPPLSPLASSHRFAQFTVRPTRSPRAQALTISAALAPWLVNTFFTIGLITTTSVAGGSTATTNIFPTSGAPSGETGAGCSAGAALLLIGCACAR